MIDQWQTLTARAVELEELENISAMLVWDQQTAMPKAAAEGRGQQLALLARLRHERLVDPELSELAARFADDADPGRRASVRVLRREIARHANVPASLVSRLAELENQAFSAWLEARAAKDFGIFAPVLGDYLAATREKAAAIDGSRDAYDVLLDEFDPGTTLASLRPMFARLGDGLSALLDAIRGAPQPPWVSGNYPIERQRALHDRVLAALRYNCDAGGVEVAEHPFTIRLGRRDVRITTHFFEDDLLFGLGGTVHEAGHALYEQGMPSTPMLLGSPSMGMHESQSRFWENHIGGSLPFARWLAGQARDTLGADAPSAEAIHRAWNRVEPSLIRIRADEVTYNFHILIRTELEAALVDGSLSVPDLPEAWNAAYRRHLGITPPNDAVGVLQDVHWAAGSFGYFPSYTLGNLYMAALAAAMHEALPGLWSDVERGEMGAALDWLRTNVHAHGREFEASEVVRRVVGDVDLVDSLLDYLWGRHGALYGATRG